MDNTARLCAMNLLLHGIGGDDCPIIVDDALRGDPGDRFDLVLTNPPFGRKSSVTVVNEEGEQEKEALTVVRDDFWASTSNKQLNFVQHVKTLLKVNGRAAVVVPDNVLFEGGAGEVVRRKLLHDCDVHTLLRLPTGIFYAQGVKANVLFFDKKPGREKPWTEKLWIYDLRTNKDFTLKTNTLKREDLDEFVACYRPENRYERKPTWSEKKPDGRWRAFTYDELVAAGQGESRHLLAPGREPGGLREPPRSRRDCGGDSGGPTGRAGAVRGDPGGPLAHESVTPCWRLGLAVPISDHRAAELIHS